MARRLSRLWRRLRSRKKGREAAPEAVPGASEHLPGRAHLVLGDGSVVEAGLDAEAQARLDYLARRVVAPPPPGR